MPADNNMILQPFVTATTTHTGATLDLHTGTPRRGLTARVLYTAAQTEIGAATVVFSIESSPNDSDWSTIAESATLGLSTDATAGDVLLPIDSGARYIRLVATVAGSRTNPTITYGADLLMARTHAGGATGTPPTPPPDLSAYLVYDSFTRTDGSLDNAETGQTWLVGTAGDATGIDSGTLRLDGATVLVDAGVADVDVRITLGTLGRWVYLIFGAPSDPLSSSFNTLQVGNGWWELDVYSNVTELGWDWHYEADIGEGDIAFASGGTFRLKVVGAEYWAYMNDVLVSHDTFVSNQGGGLATDAAYVPTGTYVGIQEYGGASTIDSFAVIAP